MTAAGGAIEQRSTEGRLVYAVGDVHGRYDLLTRLLGEIVADSRSSGRADGPPLLVFLGDYVDRGPDSAKVVEALIQLKAKPDFEVRVLKGNHEAGLLDFLADPIGPPHWLNFGGVETLRSYGVAGEVLDGGDLQAMGEAFRRRLPQRHLDFLQSLELFTVVGDYAFVHAGVRPGTPVDAQEEKDLLWIRDDFLTAPGPLDKVIVHGHTPTLEPQLLRHRLGVDTGAYATGVLTAVRLLDGDVALLQTGRPRDRGPAAAAFDLIPERAL
jgi:serine/threonine protein phosphatase 1